MAPVAVLITHHVRPGQRDAVHAVWRDRMIPAIAANPGHDAYIYCFDPADPDVICAFQQYQSAEAAASFLQTDAYRAYEREVAPLLVAPAEVRRLAPTWSKAHGDLTVHTDPGVDSQHPRTRGDD